MCKIYYINTFQPLYLNLLMSKLPENIESLDITKKEIIEQLDHILTSDLFSRSKVLSTFLKYIVEETLENRTEQLKEYTIAVNALGKNSDFNPQTDAIIRIHAGRLRRLLYKYYTGPGKTDPILIEVEKGTYIPIFRKLTENKTSEVLIENNNFSNFYRSKLTLAVLPFRNLCPNNDYQFFVDGFGEELTRIFSTEQHVAVIAHHSTRKYASMYEDVRIIGNNLGAHYLIIGTVKRSSTKIRVNVSLIETLNGTQIWSKNYTHITEKEDIIDIQDQIDHDVFSILSGHYGFIARDSASSLSNVNKQDLGCFDAILWNYHAQMTHSLEACATSRKALEKSVEKEDATNVMCLILLGDLYLTLNLLGYPNIEDPINEACRLIEKAVKLAPFSQEVHLARGFANVCLGKKDEALKSLNYCLELGPLSASISGDLGFALICAGEYKRSNTLLQQSLDLNPFCPWWYYMGFFLVHYKNENYSEAFEAAQKMNAAEEVFLDPLLTLAVKGQLGLISEAKQEIQLLNQKFQTFLVDIKAHLGVFILDQDLIDKVFEGVKMAGLKTS